MGRCKLDLRPLATAALFAAGVAACATQKPAQPPKPAMEALPADRNVLPHRSGPVVLDRYNWTEVVSLHGAALGPRWLSTERGRLIAWAELADEEPGLFTRLLPLEGEPAGPIRVAPWDASSRLLQMGRLGSSEVIVSAVRTIGARDALEAVVLGPGGELRGGPYLVVEVPASLLFVHTEPTAHGALVFWVEKVDKKADLWVALVGDRGAERPVRLAQEVSAWQIAGSSTGVAVVTREGQKAPSLVLRQLGDAGKVLGAPVPIASDVRGGLDLDLAITSKRIVVAWSEPQGGRSRLLSTTLDASGNVLTTPSPLTPSRSSQALVRLIASTKRDEFVAVWEEPLWFSHRLPSMMIGRALAGTSILETVASFSSSGEDALLPLIAEHDGRLTVVTDEEACGPWLTVPCGSRSGAPLVTFFDPKFDSAGADFVGPEERPIALAWDLECSEKNCQLLVAEEADRTRVSLVELSRSHQAPKDAPRGARLLGGGPQLLRLDDVSDVPELSALTVAPLGTPQAPRDLVSWISYFDPETPYLTPVEPAPDGRLAPVRARLATDLVSVPDRAVRTQQSVISYRASSLGGVALAPPEHGEGLLAWAAIDADDPQLFATIVNDKGARVRQKMLTKTPGEVSDVAVVRVPEGYLLAWVDGVSGAPEVHAARVDRMLSLQGPVVQVSHGARVPADIALEVVGDQVLVVWSDARGASGAGRADLFGCLLGARDARPLGSETKLVTTAGHAHGARLAVVGGDSGKTAIRLLWVESAPEDGSKFGRARSVLLDEDGRPTTPVFEIPLPPHVADTSLECKSGACRALTVVAQTGPVDAAQLWSIVFGSDEASVDLLHPLQANAPTAVVPVLAGGVGYFSDYVPEDDTWRLWRMEIDWGGAPSE